MQHSGDQQIYETLMDELNWDEGVCAIGIWVEVCGGCVRLQGAVPDVEQRLRAETIARLVPGVLDVQSSLTVDAGVPPGPHASIIRRIHAALSGVGCVNAELIQVRIEGGWVKLSGLVGSDERRQRLIWMIQKLLGIREVMEVLVMSPTVPA